MLFERLCVPKYEYSLIYVLLKIMRITTSIFIDSNFSNNKHRGWPDGSNLNNQLLKHVENIIWIKNKALQVQKIFKCEDR
jgi:hypothetical protein